MIGSRMVVKKQVSHKGTIIICLGRWILELEASWNLDGEDQYVLTSGNMDICLFQAFIMS